jgi:ComF family protein
MYPPGCACCDEPGTPFCEPCRASLVELVDPCPRCALPRRGFCVGCGGGALDGVWAAYEFGGALADAVRLLKFSARTDLGEPLGALLEPGMRMLASGGALVVPVPLSRGRLRQRGYNQAALLAHAAARAQGLAVRVDVLARVRETPAQVGLSASQRRTALLGAFSAHACVAGRDVVLVDDVMTTGATLSACALALRLEGAARVVALTVGRALP